MDLPAIQTQVPRDDQHRSQLHQMLGEMLINVTNQYFKDRDIKIDGYRFISCRFENCNMITHRGTFEFHNCLMQGGRRIFNDEAQKCCQFLMLGITEKQVSTDYIPVSLRPQGDHLKGFSVAKGSSYN